MSGLFARFLTAGLMGSANQVRYSKAGYHARDIRHLGKPRGLPRLEECLRMLLTAGSEDPATMMLLTALAAQGGPIRDLLRNEIVQELGGPDQQEDDATCLKAEFLTSVVLALSRDIAF